MNRPLLFCFLLGAILLSPTGVHADDTEIYFAQADVNNDSNEQIANVLFLIDTSGSMCDPPYGSRDCSRDDTKMAQLKVAFSEVVDGLSDGVRIGVGKFNGGADSSGYGGYVFYPVSDMDDGSRQEVKQLVNGLQGTSNTPTMEAYSEMARYMMGLPPSGYAIYGEAEEEEPRRSVNLRRVCTDERWWGCNRYEIVSSDRYSSPMNMENQCESNHIIVMTDGDPTQDSDYSSARDLTGDYCNGSYSCQRKIASWLLEEGRNSKGRSVRTWQVAFGVSDGSSQITNMRNVAVDGGTEDVRLADNASELAAEFNDILNLIAEDAQTISSPGVSVNQNNRLSHLDQIYYGMFKPEKTSVWPGNLKRYRLEDGRVVDSNGNSALDTETGYVRESAKSFWTDGEPDGPDVRKGGAVGELSDRKLIIGNANGNGSYTLDADKLEEMDAEDFGIPNNNAVPAFNTKEEVYQALLTLWGDPMHAEPLLVNYKVDEDGDDADDQVNYVFVATNGGMLHAIDTKDGTEKFAFMPDEMLKKAYDLVRSPPLKENNIRSLYGMDGSWVAYRTAKANGDADDVYIYGGMRRGGSNYYALDVSDINNPSLKWRIRGGWADESSTANADGGFSRLGQTWSTPTLTHVRVGDAIKPVLVFGGGYDPEGHDTAGSRPGQDSLGNAVYMVEALSGDRLWSIGSDDATTQVADMKWAVPGAITVVDLNFDGLADYLYFGDMGGQIFRVNLNNTAGGDSDVVEGVVRLATFGGTGTSNHRRFYEAPAIGYSRNGLRETLYVAIGSGYRAHPLDTNTEEGFFVVADKNFKSSEQQTPVALGDLPRVNGANPPSLDGSGDGWRVDFDRNGEKVMSSPTIAEGTVMFTTYVPTTADEDPDPCVVRYGNAYAYRAGLTTGDARSFTNDGSVPGEGGGDDDGDDGDDGDGDGGDGGDPGGGDPGGGGDWDGEKLDTGGIPPSLDVIRTPSGQIVVCAGLVCPGVIDPAYGMFRKQRWYPMEKDEANQYFPPVQEEDE